MTTFLVCVFGALGGSLRWIFEYALRRRHPTQRPWATVAANALGCGVAGFVAYHLLSTADAQMRVIAITGFCGGLTTFSSAFAIPAILLKEHHWRYSLALVLTTPLLCAGFFLLGMSFAH
jgi:fluoride exporter